jgi:hypothetical protein
MFDAFYKAMVGLGDSGKNVSPHLTHLIRYIFKQASSFSSFSEIIEEMFTLDTSESACTFY